MGAKQDFIKELDDIQTAIGALAGSSDAMLEVGQSLARLRALVELNVKF